jgi:hypothetical protein
MTKAGMRHSWGRDFANYANFAQVLNEVQADDWERGMAKGRARPAVAMVAPIHFFRVLAAGVTVMGRK